MKKNLILVLFILFSGVLPAQNQSETERGLRYIDLETQAGHVTAVIPSKIHAGDIISGTVTAGPKGKNDRQITRNSQTISGYVFELEGEEQPVEKGKVTWKIPAAIAGGFATLLLKDNLGNVFSTVQIPVAEEPRVQPSKGTPSKPDFKLPDFLRAGQTERITGQFDGSMQNSSVTLDDVDLNILAESPEGIFVVIPDHISGRSEISVNEQDAVISKDINILNMQLSADRLALARGQKAVVTIEVTGLEQIETDIPLRISNLTPANISMAGGNYQEMVIQNVSAAYSGTFRETVEVTASRSGEFSVLVEIEQPGPRILRLIDPGQGTLTGNDALEFKWTAMGFPENTLYDLFLYALDDDASYQPGILAGMEPVFSVKGLKNTTLILPEEAGTEKYTSSSFAYRVIAKDGATGATLADESSGFYTVSARNRCRCGSQAGTLTANLKSGNTIIGLVSLSGNPSTVNVPQGPLTLEFTGVDLNCSECNRNDCRVTNIRYNPALPAINATTSIQTLEVVVTWRCELDDCLPDSCSHTFRFKYRLAPESCNCGDVIVTVETVNVKAKRAINQNSRAVVVSHRPTGSSGSDVLIMDNNFRFDNNDEIQIRISGINARCWCRHGQCNPEPTGKDDSDANRPATIDLGENDHDASNDNFNLVRIKRDNDGWQSDGSYVINAQIRNANSNQRNIYQDFTLRYWCNQPDCSRNLCREKFRVHFGAF